MSQQVAPPPPPPVENVQPTVRVMRLYKPCMHIVPTLPHLRSFSGVEKPKSGPDFAISQFLLLPDSFGDIYLGEIFSAYISVVNGLQDLNFYQIALAVRLQTANATHDLYDSRAMKGEQAVGNPRTLLPNESVDMVVQHTLSELGTHTLRVTVNYLDNKTNELKPLRKFYRFNVLNPLEIRTVCTDIGSAYVIQCLVVNITKSMIFVEDVCIVSTLKDMEFERVDGPGSAASSSMTDLGPDPNHMPLLLAEETYACSFFARKPPGGAVLVPSVCIGVPEVKWSASMGEHGYIRGEEILAAVTSVASSATASRATGAPPPVPALSDLRGIRVVCSRCPAETVVGTPFEVILRVINDSGRATSVQLQCRDAGAGAGTDKGSMSAVGFSVNDLGLCVCGLSTQNLGSFDVAESREISLSVFPVASGLQALRSVVAVDTSNSKEYPAGTLFKIMVREDAPRGTELASRFVNDDVAKLDCIMSFDAY